MPIKSNTRAGPAVGVRLVGWARIDAPGLGPVRIAWSDVGIAAVELPRGPRGDEWPAIDAPERPLRTDWADLLRRYFAGENVDPATLPVDLHGSEFQVRVWKALRRVGRGQVRTYAGIAADVGRPRGMRAVGAANGANPIPIVVPCHRVIEAGSRLGGFTAGIDLKRKLLALEGVQTDGDHVLIGQLGLL